MHNESDPQKILNAFQSLSIYRGVLKNGPGRAAFRLISKAASGDPAGMERLSARLLDEIAALVRFPAHQVGSLWQNFLLDQIIEADNAFTRLTAGPFFDRSQSPAVEIAEAAAADLRLLRTIMNINPSSFFPEAGNAGLNMDLALRQPAGKVNAPREGSPEEPVFKLKKSLLLSPDWENAAELLAGFHRRCGFGLFCMFHALRWDGRAKALTGIPDPDPIRPEDLVGYDNERGRVVMNTERLLSGLPSCNVLLYGDRGTGKSSTVKSLINIYGSRGLRILELPKAHLDDFPRVLSAVKGVCLKFVIFIDDLSFEEHETEYKALKSALDGSLQAGPQNTVVYATSNRRHMVREYFDERRQEVGGLDTLQEKLSLSDRFGVTVLFLSPDQDLYLKIVEGLARRRGIDIPADQLRLQALEWEHWHNSRSGRTARQFIDHLSG